MRKDPIVNLKQFRQKMKLTQAAAAAKIGIDQRQWNRYENGHNDIPVHYVIAICKAYNYSADELLNINTKEGRNSGEDI